MHVRLIAVGDTVASRIRELLRLAPVSTIRFLAIFGLTIASLVSAVAVVGFGQVGLHTSRSNSVCRAIESRQALAASMEGPKVVFIGGSGVRAGFSAVIAARELGTETLNFGLLAALGPGIILDAARDVLGAGDTAVLALEYNHYVYDAWNEVALEVMFGCMGGYLMKLPARQVVSALLALDIRRLFRVIRFRMTEQNGARSVSVVDRSGRDDEVAIARRHGDRPLISKEFPPISLSHQRRMAAYRPMDIELDGESFGVGEIRRFVDWAHRNGVEVVATWPNTIDFPEYRLETGFDEIAGFYEEQGVPVIGQPSLGMYPLELFYDTQYHLKPQGIVRRTEAFVGAMKSAMWNLGAPADYWVR